jgi:hypothetical protein
LNVVADRLLYRALPLSLVVGVMLLLRVTGVGLGGSGAQSTTIAIGFLLTCAFIGGQLSSRSLPRITGFLLVACWTAPSGLDPGHAARRQDRGRSRGR